MSRHYKPIPLQAHKPFWKSPAMLGTLVLGIAIASATLWNEYITQPIIHIRADDNSDSAAHYTLQRQLHCQTSSQYYKPGDTVIAMPFASKAVLTEKMTVFNSLSLLGECQKTEPEVKDKRWGTSLILLLQRINKTVQTLREQNNSNPVAATILIQDSEPGPGLPELKSEAIKKLFDEMNQQRIVVSIIVPPGDLYDKLETSLQGNIRLCPLKEKKNETEVRKSIEPCIEEAFHTARHLKDR
jgi:hypothetical protein